MGRRRPWHVIYVEQRGDQPRSRSFYEETTALAWAQGLVRNAGDEACAWVVPKD